MSSLNYMSRRLFVCGAAPFAGVARAATKPDEHLFRTSEFDVTVTMEYHDLYRSRGFRFREGLSNRSYCLSAEGREDRECLKNFNGSLAIARYKVRPRVRGAALPALREYVRTVDYDLRLPLRPPFDRTIQLDQGMGSDLQAFGYQADENDKSPIETHGPWYLFRQDLYLGPQPKPFLAIYWKHALRSIRALDLIPGDETWPLIR